MGTNFKHKSYHCAVLKISSRGKVRDPHEILILLLDGIRYVRDHRPHDRTGPGHGVMERRGERMEERRGDFKGDELKFQ